MRKINGCVHRIIFRFLNFTICHKHINEFFSRCGWYHKMLYEEAQAVIGNRPWSYIYDTRRN